MRRLVPRASRSPAEVAAKKAELFAHLRSVHDTLTLMQDEHNATEYKCHRHGSCCVVGLELHYMECEYIAENLKASCAGDKKKLQDWIERLEYSFTDKSWTWADSVGDHFCAFYEDGCSIYPVRPSVCRMYGVTIEVDEWCPRKRVERTGLPYVYAQKESDRLAAEFYRTLDTYGRMFPKLDYTVYMPRGVLEFLVPPEHMKKLRARTAGKFWSREKGYRTQYTASYRRREVARTNVKFPFKIPVSPGAK